VFDGTPPCAPLPGERLEKARHAGLPAADNGLANWPLMAFTDEMLMMRAPAALDHAVDSPGA